VIDAVFGKIWGCEIRNKFLRNHWKRVHCVVCCKHYAGSMLADISVSAIEIRQWRRESRRLLWLWSL